MPLRKLIFIGLLSGCAQTEVADPFEPLAALEPYTVYAGSQIGEEGDPECVLWQRATTLEELDADLHSQAITLRDAAHETSGGFTWGDQNTENLTFQLTTDTLWQVTDHPADQPAEPGCDKINRIEAVAMTHLEFGAVNLHMPGRVIAIPDGVALWGKLDIGDVANPIPATEANYLALTGFVIQGTGELFFGGMGNPESVGFWDLD